MEHSIFVTVAEFLANEGVLTQERELFLSDGLRYHNIGWFDESKNQANQYGTTIVTNARSSWQAIDELIYVNIKCIPVYN